MSNMPVAAQPIASLLSIQLILANSNRASASLFTFTILLSIAPVLVIYFAGALSASRMSASTPVRAILIVAFLFILFAFYGTGVEASLWGVALLAIGVVVRAVMHRLAPPETAAASPAAPS